MKVYTGPKSDAGHHRLMEWGPWGEEDAIKGWTPDAGRRTPPNSGLFRHFQREFFESSHELIKGSRVRIKEY